MSNHGHGVDIPPARPRPRPPKPTIPDASRESGAVRASVLDAAMELGLGVNPAVADWMFNNQLKEEDEELIPTSPGLTHSVEDSPGSSPLSGRYPLTPSSPSSQNHSSGHAQKIPGNFHLQHIQPPNTVPFAISSESHTLIPHVPDAIHPSHPTTPSKLKKKRSANRDGYESDGGFMSDLMRKKDKKKDKKEKGKKGELDFVPPVPPFAASPMPGSSANSFLTLETASDLTIDGTDPRKRTKSLVKAQPIPNSAPSSPFEFGGYETDSSKKSKKKKKGSNDDDKDMKKARSLFFRLGNKSSKSDLAKDKDGPRSIPSPVEPPPLPIAERFATTLNRETGAPMISLGSSAPRSQAGGSTPGSGLGIDLGLGLSGEMFSMSPPPRTKTPPRPRTADSVVSPPTHPANPTPPLPAPAIPPPHSASHPPVAFPSASSPVSYGPRPGSAGTMATSRTSTSTNNTNAYSYTTGAARTSTATTVSTSQSHSVKSPVLSRQSSNNDVPAVPTPAVPGLSSVPPTPSRRRVLPFIGAHATRSSASSGDSFEKDKREEKEREKQRKKEMEKEREKEREAKKPQISLPLTRDTEATHGSTSLARNPSLMSPPTSSLSVPNTPLRTRSNGTPTELSGHPLPRPAHPPVSHNFQSNPVLTRQTSLSQLQGQTQPGQNTLSRQTSLTTLRPEGYGNGPPGLMPRSTSPIPSGRTSPMLRAPGMNGVGSPPLGNRLSGLPGPPSVFLHHDIPPPSPPPLSPLPNVPSNPSPVPPSSTTSGTNGHLTVNVGIAVTTGESPLPSPLLVSSPSYNGAPSPSGKAPPTSFNPSSAAAGSVLRAKVQRRLSQQNKFPSPSANGASATGGSPTSTSSSSPVSTVPPSAVPIINAPPALSRGMSLRGRESPFPVLPLSKGSSPSASANNLTVNNRINTALPPRAMSPRSGWEDSNSERLSTGAEEDDDGMEDVRDVLARFRESRVHDSSRKGSEEVRNPIDDVIATRKSHEAFEQSAPSVLSNSSLNTNMPVSPSPSSNVMPMGSDSRYDNFVVEEYYGQGDANGTGLHPGSALTDDEHVYDEYDPEDASYYPEDELSNRRSRRRRSTVYMSDEENEGSNSGHGHDKGRSSRYTTASVYSRTSFLDTEKSGELRQRFLNRVEAMLDERGERVPAVPPVPKLPEEFVAEHKRAAAVARREYEDYVMKRTVGVGARKVPAGSGMPMSPGR
ncbi:hypothetical protein NP233_g7177 [Leucocoprinus birnbaumii]|uniref:Uncharacterized protein n=1 Tax=Leucocoprinus birnbaumii TaxID=56174 RepID=A0AAD5VSD7_9AGAR|nr:hypothetical protein NP233_g7177 [Leucocoprinus birnbaumii]